MYKKLVLAAAIAAMSVGAQAGYTETFETVATSTGSNNGGRLVTADPGGFDWSSSIASRVYTWSLARADSQLGTGSLVQSNASTLGSWVAALYGDNSQKRVDVSFAKQDGSLFGFQGATFVSASAAELSISGLLANGSVVSQTISLAAKQIYNFSDSANLFGNVSQITFQTMTDTAKVGFDNVVTVSPVPQGYRTRMS